MLVLTRKLGEDIFFGDGIRIVIKEIKGKQVRIGIEAPPSVLVYRGEIYHQIEEENKRAAVVDFEEVKGAVDSLKRIIKMKGRKEEE